MLKVEVNVVDTLRKDEVYTIDDIYNLPDGERAELINGQIYYMAPPSRTHQNLTTIQSCPTIYVRSLRYLFINNLPK